MQNRRIIDAIFSRLGIEPRVGIEASSMISQFCYLETGDWSSVMPERYARVFGAIAHLSYAKLVDPIVSNAIGLLVPQRDPLPALVSAFREFVSARNEAEPTDR